MGLFYIKAQVETFCGEIRGSLSASRTFRLPCRKTNPSPKKGELMRKLKHLLEVAKSVKWLLVVFVWAVMVCLLLLMFGSSDDD